MLLRFSVENYMSIRQKAILALEPSKDTEHSNSIINKGLLYASSSIIIYGLNSYGKTNLFRALTTALMMLRTSNNRQMNDKLGFVPFKFSSETITKPGRFEFQFVAADNKKYIYGFVVDDNTVFEEYLYVFNSNRITKIFERSDNDRFYFTAREKNVLQPLTRWNTPNKFFIVTASMWNAESVKIPFEWLMSGIDTFAELNLITRDIVMKYQGDRAAEYINFTEKIMREIDATICKTDVKIKKEFIHPGLSVCYPEITANTQMLQPTERTSLEVNICHKIRDVDGKNEKLFNLPLVEEASSVQILFAFAPILKDAFDKGRTIIIDEIEKQFDPVMVRYIVSLFSDQRVNTHGAQMIVITNETKLLTLTKFRRDQIYFLEKDKSTAESRLRCLNSYPVRKGENIENGFFSGRYGDSLLVNHEQESDL